MSMSLADCLRIAMSGACRAIDTSLQRRRVGKLDNHHALGLPDRVVFSSTTWRQTSLCNGRRAGNQRAHLDPVFLELGSVGDCVFSDQISRHWASSWNNPPSHPIRQAEFKHYPNGGICRHLQIPVLA
jgi:hypothetical protein